MARYRITAPNPVTAMVVGVSFAQGVAEIDNTKHRKALAYFRRHGYGVDGLDEAAKKPPAKKAAPTKADGTAGDTKSGEQPPPNTPEVRT